MAKILKKPGATSIWISKSTTSSWLQRLNLRKEKITWFEWQAIEGYLECYSSRFVLYWLNLPVSAICAMSIRPDLRGPAIGPTGWVIGVFTWTPHPTLSWRVPSLKPCQDSFGERKHLPGNYPHCFTNNSEQKAYEESFYSSFFRSPIRDFHSLELISLLEWTDQFGWDPMQFWLWNEKDIGMK